MSKLSNELCVDEKILWSGKPLKPRYHLTRLWGPFTVFMFFSAFILVTTRSIDTLVSFFPLILGSVLLFVFFLYILPVITPLNVDYMITNKRILTRYGVHITLFDLTRVQEAYVIVGYIDRVLGTGSIYISTDSDTGVIECVRNPDAVLELVRARANV